MAKNIRKYYGDDGVTLLKTEETQITSEANDVNKVVKKITAYKADGKVDFVEETEDFYNAKTGEKIIPNKNTNTSTNSNIGNKVTVTAYIPYGAIDRKYDMVDPCATITHGFGQYLYAGYPSAFFPAKIF